MMHPQLSNPGVLITVGMAADLCQVYRGTVQRWIALHKLKAHQLPSGHYRIRVGDLRHFMHINHLPMPAEMTNTGPSRLRILIVDQCAQTRKQMKSALHGLNHDVAAVSNGFDALIKIGDWKPSLVIVNPALAELDGVKALERIAAIPETKNTRFLIYGDSTSDSLKKRLNRNPCVVGYLNQPKPAVALRKQVQETMRRDGKHKD